MQAGRANDGGEAGADQSACSPVTATFPPEVPTVMLLVDSSSSMFETAPAAWSLLYDAMMDPTAGVVPALADRIRFGFFAYHGDSSSWTETDPACATVTEVPAALDNVSPIDAQYSAIQWPLQRPLWSTPTGHAITRAAAVLSAFDPDPPGPKRLLLVTDGNPSTCEFYNPMCGQDVAIKAAQDAYSAGIGLLAAGIGSIVLNPNSGCPSSARCGPDHLQDLANAGVGAPVQAAPGCADFTSSSCAFKYEQCNQGTLRAAYVETAAPIGAPLLFDQDDTPADFAAKVIAALDQTLLCTVALDLAVTGDPARSEIRLNGALLPFGATARGWSLESDGHHLTLEGTACDDFSKPNATLTATFLCDAGEPVAERR